MIQVGLVGLPPAWDKRYRPALERLRQRIEVRAVYDPVASRAEQVADELGARPVGGFAGLLARPEIEAFLFLDAGWYGIAALQWMVASGRPVYAAASLGEDIAALKVLHADCLSAGLTLMPEFSRRYTPATSRLKELIATRIGPARTIVVEADLGSGTPSEFASAASGPRDPDCGLDDTDRLVGLFDWCRYVVGTPPTSVESIPEASAGRTIRVDFRPPRSGGPSPVAELRLNPQEANGPRLLDEPALQVSCERGEAVLRSASEIVWTAEAESNAESLASDRPEVEVMLDHFCRRVVGGLIPVADVADVFGNLELVQSARESHRRGGRVMLNAPG